MSTPTKQTPEAALNELTLQHAALRLEIERCDELADQLDAGTIDPAVLLDAITNLRRSFDAHNQFEERLLHPLLIDADWSGAVRVSRMVEDHVREHETIRRAIDPKLGNTTTAALRAVLDSLRDHLESEERGFLSRRVLRTAE